MTVKIIAENLTQEEAYNLEREIIMDYVFNKGYGIDIIGYNNKDELGHLTNQTFGGDGQFGSVHTEEWCHQHSLDMLGENNPMYGINLWDTYSEEKSNEIRVKLSKASSGENNPMYGISPKDRMSQETYDIWRIKQQINKIGDNNPNWHNDTLKKKYAENPELALELCSRPGVQNGRARKVYVYDENMNFINKFDYIGECCEWLNTFETKPKKINSMRASISKVINTGKSYKNKLFYDFEQ